MDRLKKAAATGQGLAHLSPAMVNAAVALGLSELEALDVGETESKLARMALKIEARCYEFRSENGAFPSNGPQYLLMLEAVSNKRPRRDPDAWQGIFEDFSKTGLTLKDFCQRRKIPYEAARRARSRLKEKGRDNRDMQNEDK